MTPGTAFLTLRSDGMDKYAQADGRFIGKPGVPTGITAEGPALKGATNLVLGAVDHRETAYSPRAFREIYKFIAGREPERIAIAPQAEVKLSGLVTGTPGGIPTNRPVGGCIGRGLSGVARYRRTDRRRRSQLTDRRRRPLGPGAGRSSLVSRDGADRGRIDHHAFLPVAVSALLRCRASSRRARPGPRGRRRRLRRSDVAAAGLFRPAPRYRAARRQGADRRQAGRADRFAHHLAAFGRRGRASGCRPVQSRSGSWRGHGRLRKTGLRSPS